MLDVHDIQGNILRGYRSNGHARFLYFQLPLPDRARAGLARIIPHVTPADWGEKPPEATVNLAFTFAGLRQLQLPFDSLASFPAEFQTGMAARAPALGDTGASAPDMWELIWTSGAVHLLVMIYAGSKDAVGAMSQSLEEVLQSYDFISSGPAQDCAALPGQREHFGFRDGLSNPLVAGEPPVGDDKHRHRRRDNLRPTAAGEFILGQPDEGGEEGILPLPRLLIRNGTFLVLRKLQQDVPRFRNFVAEQRRLAKAAWDAARVPNQPDLHADFIGAKMIGRWPDGSPLTCCPDGPDPTRATANDFTYADDTAGARCPLGAHIRRTNPRDTLGFDGELVDRHRLIRRGISYGPMLEEGMKDGKERGLMFLAFNASIRRQFEFVQQQWVQYGDSFGLGNDKDPLLGGSGGMIIPGDYRAKPAGRPALFCPLPEGDLPEGELPQFVTLRGGDYFFVPSLTALRLIAANQVRTSL